MGRRLGRAARGLGGLRLHLSLCLREREATARQGQQRGQCELHGRSLLFLDPKEDPG